MDYLLDGINDPNLSLTGDGKGNNKKDNAAGRSETEAKERVNAPVENADNIHSQDTVPSPMPTEAERSTISPTSGREQYWLDFLSILSPTEEKTDKSDRLICKLDRDLADSLDDCNINGRCRSDLVNAIVRAFFNTYLPKLLPYRKAKKSLFENYKPTKA